MTIHQSREAEIASLLTKEDLAEVLPYWICANEHTMKLVNGNQPA